MKGERSQGSSISCLVPSNGGLPKHGRVKAREVGTVDRGNKGTKDHCCKHIVLIVRLRLEAATLAERMSNERPGAFKYDEVTTRGSLASVGLTLFKGALA